MSLHEKLMVAIVIWGILIILVLEVLPDERNKHK